MQEAAEKPGPWEALMRSFKLDPLEATDQRVWHRALEHAKAAGLDMSRSTTKTFRWGFAHLQNGCGIQVQDLRLPQ